jgi:hypothetical protein
MPAAHFEMSRLKRTTQLRPQLALCGRPQEDERSSIENADTRVTRSMSFDAAPFSWRRKVVKSFLWAAASFAFIACLGMLLGGFHGMGGEHSPY